MTGRTVAVTGATGFIGRNLIPVLTSRGYKVRAIARNPHKEPVAGVEWVKADLLDPVSLSPALAGVDSAYYLVHSMEAGKGSSFAERDRQAAVNFVESSERAGVRRTIYLGGLGETGPKTSEHLRSRAEVGRLLQSAQVPATVLRAAIILGAGGASWEMLRQLVEKLPVMVTPRWLETRCQPIALRDTLGYLAGCLDSDRTIGSSFDIGGPDVLTYRQMMLTLAEVMKKRRYIVPIPILTPRLSSYWIDLVTDVPAALAKPLIEGLSSEVVCREHKIRDLVPLSLTPYREAIGLALEGKV